MACYYVVIRSTHLRDGQLRSIKGVFRGPIGASGAPGAGMKGGSSLYCELCDKRYERQQQYDNHTSSYDHHHRQRLKELKQREFYRQLGRRRQRRGRKQWPRSPEQEDSTHSVAGLGPMFRSTTVELDMSVDDPNSCTKEPVKTQVQSSSLWSSNSPAKCNLSTMETANIGLETSHTQINVINQATPHNASHTVPSTVTNKATDGIQTTQNPHRSHSHVRPICFSLPKRNYVLQHQSAAVFLQPQKSKEKETKTPKNIDRMDTDFLVDFKKQTDHCSRANEASTPTQNNQLDLPKYVKNSPFSQRPKEPFHSVHSRNGDTVLLWPSEMVSYTRTAPSISFSVNPLLYNFRGENTTKGGPMDKRDEVKKGESCLSKQAEQKQVDAQGGGSLSTHKRKREEEEEEQTGTGVEVVHCISSNFDESSLKCPFDSDFKGNCVVPKKRSHKKRRRARRAGRTKMKETRKLKAKPMNVSSPEKGPGRQNIVNSKDLRKDQTALNDHKRAELLSHLSVSHFNRCEQLCSQVKSQPSHHLSLQSVPEWSRGFKKLPSGGAACNTAISLAPSSDIEMSRCLTITPCPALSCTDVWEAHAETQLQEKPVVSEDLVTRREMLGKRTFDEAFNLNTLCDRAQTVPVRHTMAEHTSLSLQVPQTQGHCDVHTKRVRGTPTSSKTSDTSSANEVPPTKIKKEKYMKNCLNLMYIRSDMNIQGPCGPQVKKGFTNPTTQNNTDTTYSYCEHRPSDTKRNQQECQKTASEHCLVTQNKCNDSCSLNNTTQNGKSQVEHCMTWYPGTTHNCQCDYTHHFTKCNYSEKERGVVVLIRTHPDQRRKEDEKKQVKAIRKNPTREREWACLPVPAYLHPFQPLSIPTSPFALIPAHFPSQPSSLPPLLPPAFYTSTPVPVLDRPPYALPVFSLQSGSPSLYNLPPPSYLPMQYLVSKATLSSFYGTN